MTVPRVAPHNVEAEQALLGAILMSNRGYHQVSDFLREEHFHDPFHGRIYVEIGRLIDAGTVADPVTLLHRFDEDPDLGGVDPRAYVAELAAQVVSVGNTRHYGDIVRDLAEKRRLIDIYAAGLEEALDPSAPKAAELVERGETRLFAMAGEAGATAGNVVTLAGAMDAADEMIQRAQHGMTGVSTGLIALDRRLGGLQPKDLYVLAGRPSMGKTAAALSISFNAADWIRRGARKGHVLFFSLEMGREQLAARIYARLTGISASDQLGQLGREQWLALADAKAQVRDLPLLIDDDGALSVAQIRARARRLHRTHGLALVVVDYLGLVRPTDHKAPKVHQIEEITQAMKALAKGLAVPVLLLAQLSRNVEQREDKRPQLADLRDSGAIEQDADAVMFVYREEYYVERETPGSDADPDDWTEFDERMSKVRNVGEIITAKLRQGRIGIDRLHFDGVRQAFTDIHPEGRA